MDRLPAKEFLSIVFKGDLENTSALYSEVIEILKEYMTGVTLTVVLDAHKMSLHKFLYLISLYPSTINLYDDACIIHKKAFKEKLITVIEKQSGEDWRAASWLLERMYPDEFGKKLELKNTSQNTDDPSIINDYINADFTKVTDNGGDDGKTDS